jgi:hypothetical protein
MKTSDVFTYFGTKAAAARALGYTAQAFYNWGDHPPEMVQFKLEVLTEGRLKRTPNTGERTWSRKAKV